jgi:hypothetical protein
MAWGLGYITSAYNTTTGYIASATKYVVDSSVAVAKTTIGMVGWPPPQVQKTQEDQNEQTSRESHGHETLPDSSLQLPIMQENVGTTNDVAVAETLTKMLDSGTHQVQETQGDRNGHLLPESPTSKAQQNILQPPAETKNVTIVAEESHDVQLLQESVVVEQPSPTATGFFDTIYNTGASTLRTIVNGVTATTNATLNALGSVVASARQLNNMPPSEAKLMPEDKVVQKPESGILRTMYNVGTNVLNAVSTTAQAATNTTLSKEQHGPERIVESPLTDQPATQEASPTIQQETHKAKREKSFWDKVVDFIKTPFLALARLLGITSKNEAKPVERPVTSNQHIDHERGNNISPELRARALAMGSEMKSKLAKHNNGGTLSDSQQQQHNAETYKGP